jgi:hypothetical protein
VGVKTIGVQSSFSANSDSRFFTCESKVEDEEGIKAFGLYSYLIFRPGLQDRCADARLNERIGLVVNKVLKRWGGTSPCRYPDTRLPRKVKAANRRLGSACQFTATNHTYDSDTAN